jgi:AcrR family transcriptional regulator
MKPLDPEKEIRIIQSVITIAGKKGLAGISITEISKKAGLGVGTLYTYFRNKEEIIQAAYSVVESKISEQAYKDFDVNLPIRDSLQKIYTNVLHYRLKHYDEDIFIDQYRQSVYVQLNYAKQYEDFITKNKQLYDLLKRGQKKGIIIKQTPEMIISFLYGSVRELSNIIFQKIIPFETITIEHGFNMVWKGISK